MRSLIVLFFTLISTLLISQKVSFQEHVELGDVHWLRDYDQAFVQAKKENKAVLILFQEVPGCSTCRNYGQQVLTHPLLVDAIESEFVPLCIFNNHRGADAKILEKYNEPSWNNPVVRIVDAQEKNLIKRLSGNYSAAGLIQSMNDAQLKSGKLIPEYMSLLEQELKSDQEEIYLSMFCFWSGEKEIANIDGVLGTQAGFMNGREVVKVSFDKTLTDAKSIHKQAQKKSCGDKLYTKENKYRMDKESKYYMQHTLFKHVPLTPLQATKVNRAIALREDPIQYLSPLQKKIYQLIKSKKGKGFDNYIEKDFVQSLKKLRASNAL